MRSERYKFKTGRDRMSVEMEDARHADTVPAKPKLYLPLNQANSWSDAFRIVIGWILVIVFSVVSGGLFVLYEVNFAPPWLQLCMSTESQVANYHACQ